MNRFRSVLLLVIGGLLPLLCATAVHAQNPDYVLSISSASGGPQSSVDLSTTVDNSAGQDLNGWSYGVCHDPAGVTLNAGSIVASAEVLAALGFADTGDFGFYQVNELPGEGWTVGVVIDLFGVIVLTPGVYELNIVSYTLVGPENTSTDVCYCNTLGGPPPVDVVVVIGGGTSVGPVTNCGTVEIVGSPDPVFTFTAPSVDVNYSPATGAASFAIDLSITEEFQPPPFVFPTEAQGFSMGLDGDDTLLASTNVDPSLLETHLGLAPGDLGFFGPATFDGDMTVGVVFDLFGLVVGTFETATPVLTVSYDTVASTLIGDNDGEVTPLTWSDNLTPPGGSQPVANVMVVGGGSSVPVGFSDGLVNLIPVLANNFIRGDANDSGMVDIADGVWIILELFVPGSPPSTCFDATDANNDGTEDTADAVYIFNFLFLAGAPPSEPWPNCGNVGTPQNCESQTSCP